MVGMQSYRRRGQWPAGLREPGSVTDCNSGVLTERDSAVNCGSLAVERVVDRAWRALSAFCAFCAFGRAFRAASALRAGQRGHGKEKVYGSIP